jgi:hypothetical protein
LLQLLREAAQRCVFFSTPHIIHTQHNHFHLIDVSILKWSWQQPQLFPAWHCSCLRFSFMEHSLKAQVFRHTTSWTISFSSFGLGLLRVGLGLLRFGFRKALDAVCSI